ncbi:MAG: DUF4249 domain-containing protein [Bacteroidota bacterium]
MQKILFYLIALLLLLSSCQEKIELELNDGNERLVVEGSLTNQDTTQQIVLSKTSSYFTAEKTPRVSGATVTVSDGQNTMPFPEISDGIYQSEYPFAAEVGKTYTLLVELKDAINETMVYTASETMPQLLQLDSITAEFLPNPQDDANIQVKAWGQEPATPNNYYVWDLYINANHYSDTLNERTFTDDELVNGSYIPGLPIYFYDGDVNDTIDVYTQSISEAYFSFLMAFIQEASFGGGDFSGPPANIQGNISDGALGYFAVKAVSRNRTIFKP